MDGVIPFCAGCDCTIQEGQPFKTISVGDQHFDVHTDGRSNCVARAEAKLGIRIPPIEERVCDHARVARGRRPVARLNKDERDWKSMPHSPGSKPEESTASPDRPKSSKVKHGQDRGNHSDTLRVGPSRGR
ncbi:TPA: hypothetical protein DEA21_04545 [Candidatus Uhrbacteria bacterium]|nr:hypothetical protein [Candidatus Uhrbacteria bacterium]